MTLQQAIDKARKESKNGYVQHVNRSEYVHNEYTVSDWYDFEVTVKSFENGKEIA